MILVVTASAAELLEPNAFSALSVRSALDTPGLRDAVARLGLGRVDADGAHVWLDPAVLRTAEEDREAALTGMLAYAATHGWVDDDGRVRAHLEA